MNLALTGTHIQTAQTVNKFKTSQIPRPVGSFMAPTPNSMTLKSDKQWGLKCNLFVTGPIHPQQCK